MMLRMGATAIEIVCSLSAVQAGLVVEERTVRVICIKAEKSHLYQGGENSFFFLSSNTLFAIRCKKKRKKKVQQSVTHSGRADRAIIFQSVIEYRYSSTRYIYIYVNDNR